MKPMLAKFEDEKFSELHDLIIQDDGIGKLKERVKNINKKDGKSYC